MKRLDPPARIQAGAHPPVQGEQLPALDLVVAAFAIASALILSLLR